VFYDDGSGSTCPQGCSTGFIYKTVGDPSPQSMYGCFDQFEIYRTIDSADAAAALSTAVDGSSPSSTEPSSPSSTSSTAGSSSHIHPVIIAVAVSVVILLLAAIAGLTAWIIILKRRQKTQSRPTELQPGPSTVNKNVELKAALPTKEVLTTELPGPVTETKQPWSTTVSPVEQGQEIWNKHDNQPTVMELPAYPMKNGYQELPG